MLKFLNKNKAFTLIEMLITAVIFSIVIGTATGVFVSAIRLQKYNLAYQQLLDQTSYVMEYMSRAIRMAKRNEGSICLFSNSKNYNWGAGYYIEFATYHGQCWKFSRELITEGVYQLVVEIDSGDKIPLTSDDFDVENFNVIVSGDEIDDDLQPRITIFMEIKGEGSGNQPKIQIQTTISQRNLDI